MTHSSRPLYGACLGFWIVTLLVFPWLCHASTHTFGWANDVIQRLTIFLGTFAGIVCLVAGLGLDVSATPLGVVASGRNRYSLSRLQMSLWTVVILSGLMALAVCRAWSLMSVPDHGALSTALDINIPTGLFAVMGISFFSATAVPSILALKAQTPTTPAQVATTADRCGEPIHAKGNVVQRPLSLDPRLSDLVQGDDLATAGTVDLSKVQQLLITILLIGAYFAMLLSVFHSGNAVLDPDPQSNGTYGLPGLSERFVSLLAVSHAGYLAYKAAPRSAADQPPASVSAAGVARPPSPDRAGLSA